MLTITVKYLQNRTLAVILRHEVHEIRSRHIFAVIAATAQRLVAFVKNGARIGTAAIPHLVVARPIGHRFGKNAVGAHIENMRHLMAQKTHSRIVARIISHLPDYPSTYGKCGITPFYGIKKKLNLHVFVK